MKATQEYREQLALSIAAATTINEVLRIALNVLDNKSRPIKLAVGPVSAGEDPERNKGRLKIVLEYLDLKGISTFNYLPFRRRVLNLSRQNFWSSLPLWQRLLRRLGSVVGKRRFSEEEESLFQKHLEQDFYLPLLKEGRFSELLMLPGWMVSSSAWQIRDVCRKEGIHIHEIPTEKVRMMEKEVFFSR